MGPNEAAVLYHSV